MIRKIVIIVCFIFLLAGTRQSIAQCSVCTRTAQQLGEKPAKGMNAGILYLAFAPFAIAGYVFYRWRKDNTEG